jgi:hypothetical protein
MVGVTYDVRVALYWGITNQLSSWVYKTGTTQGRQTMTASISADPVEGGEAVTLTLTLANPVDHETSVQRMDGGTAEYFVDYPYIKLPTFAAGSTTASTEIRVVDDDRAEGCETLTWAITMWPGEDRAVREWYRIYIVDNDGDAASNSCAALKAQEGAGGLDLRLVPDSIDASGSALVPILSEPAPTDMYVWTRITGGTAVAGRDYDAQVYSRLKIGGTERTSVSRQTGQPAIYLKHRIRVADNAPGTRTIEFTVTGNYWMKASQFPERRTTLTVTLDELRNLPAPTASGEPHAQRFGSPQQESPSGYVVPGYNAPQGQSGGTGETGKQQSPDPVEHTPPGEENSGQQQQGDPPPEEAEPAPQNSAPTVASPIGDVREPVVGGSRQIDLSGVFADADGDALTYSASSTDEDISAGYVQSDELLVLALGRGTATITVTAEDGNGGTVSDSFTVTVKEAPAVAAPIDDIAGIEAGASKQVSLAAVFADADGDALTLSASSSDGAVATVSVAGDQASLTVRAVSAGAATITVTAEDADGNRVGDTFEVTVVAPPEPEPTPELPEAVARHDADEDGVISLSEYLAAVADLGDGVTVADLVRIRQAWVDGGYQQ